MNVCICENDDVYRQTMCSLVADIRKENGMGCGGVFEIESAEEALAYVHMNDGLTLYFLNMDLGKELYGLEIAKEIRERDRGSAIVFITRFAAQAQMTFKYKLQALDYIVKGSVGLRSRIEDCLLIANAMFSSDLKRKKLQLSGKSEMVSIPMNDIYFLESSNSSHRICIHHAHGCYEGRGTLKEFYGRLDGNFMYCHKSFIVNREKIQAIDMRERKIFFENGSSCWYSKEYARKIIQWAAQA